MTLTLRMTLQYCVRVWSERPLDILTEFSTEIPPRNAASYILIPETLVSTFHIVFDLLKREAQ